MKPFTFAFVLTLLTVTTKAHELPFDSLKIDSQNVQIVASFALNENQINSIYHDSAKYFDSNAWFDSYLAKENINECMSTSQAKACGIIDPFVKAPKEEPFYIAGLVAIYLCNAYGSLNLGNYNNGLVPMFTAPSNFISSDSKTNDHHLNYTLSEGIAFNCVFELASTTTVKHNR